MTLRLKLPSSYQPLLKSVIFFQLILLCSLCSCKSSTERENNNKNEIVQFENEKNANKTTESIMKTTESIMKAPKQPKFFDEFDCEYCFCFFFFTNLICPLF